MSRYLYSAYSDTHEQDVVGNPHAPTRVKVSLYYRRLRTTLRTHFALNTHLRCQCVCCTFLTVSSNEVSARASSIDKAAKDR